MTNEEFDQLIDRAKLNKLSQDAWPSTGDPLEDEIQYDLPRQVMLDAIARRQDWLLRMQILVDATGVSQSVFLEYQNEILKIDPIQFSLCLDNFIQNADILTLHKLRMIPDTNA